MHCFANTQGSLRHQQEQQHQHTQQAASFIAASAAGRASSRAAHTAAATSGSSHNQSAAGAAATSSSVSAAAAAAAAGLLPPVDESAAAALESTLQHEDNEQLLQEAAAVSAAAGPGAGPQTAAAAGLPGPDSETAGGWGEGVGVCDDGTAAATKLQSLDLHDHGVQQQRPRPLTQQLHQPPQGLQAQAQPQQPLPMGDVPQHQRLQQQQQQRQGGTSGHGELDLQELLQPVQSGGMDLDAGSAKIDIPVLQQPQPQPGWVQNPDEVILPPGYVASRQQGFNQGLDGDWDSSSSIGIGFKQRMFEEGDPAAGEGVGPMNFGFPVEKPPVLPDEPAQLLHVPENPADSYLL
jgi:hypothetical protein